MDIPPGHDAWVVGDEPAVLLDFAGSIDASALPREHERMVTTLLMTDIVDSTLTASRLGDAAWKQLLSDHNRLVRAQLLRFGGSEVNTTGDGFLATFRSAVAGLRCAAAILDALRETGLEVRIGVHTGEVEPMGSDIGGVAVHAAARIMALAGPSEVFASSVTVGLADGSGLAFEARGPGRSRAWIGRSRSIASRIETGIILTPRPSRLRGREDEPIHCACRVIAWCPQEWESDGWTRFRPLQLAVARGRPHATRSKRVHIRALCPRTERRVGRLHQVGGRRRRRRAGRGDRPGHSAGRAQADPECRQRADRHRARR